MTTEDMERLLVKATVNFRDGVAARSSGKVEEARNLFFRSAEALFNAANLTSERSQRESRKRLALELMAEAESLIRPAESPKPIQPSTPGVPAFTSRPAAPPPEKIEAKPNRESKAQAPGGDDAQAETWLVHEKPSIGFGDIAGLEDVKEQIRLKLLYPFQHPEFAEQYGIRGGGGILLYGPPGTGKTLIARAIAGEIDAAFFSIKPSEVMNQWVGLSEQNVGRLFASADQFPLSVIFIDEIESLAPKRRGQGSTIMQRVVPQILAELDGFEKRKNTLLFIGATNEPWALDQALLRPGRLDRLIYVSPPDAPARCMILQLNLKNVPIEEALDLDAIAQRSERFSGADMAALARRVREKVFNEVVQNGVMRQLGMDDFDAVLQGMRPSVRDEDLRMYEKFAEDQGGK